MADVDENVEPSKADVQALQDLKTIADKMGLSYHPSIGLEKLQLKVDEANQASKVVPRKPYVPETKAQRNMRKRREANRLIRLRITCMNPNKAAWTGEIFCVSNAVIGTIKKFVPFNIEEGYHIPVIIYEQLKARKYQQFSPVKLANGQTKMVGKLVPEFSMEEMPPLTKEELKDLADRQALNHSIDA